MGMKINQNTLCIIAITFLQLGCNYDPGRISYVDADASTGGDGTTWKSAFKNLQDALDFAPRLFTSEMKGSNLLDSDE